MATENHTTQAGSPNVDIDPDKINGSNQLTSSDGEDGGNGQHSAPRYHVFAAWYVGIVIALSICALILDFSPWGGGNHWFQRSGALLTLAGIEAQYAKLLHQQAGNVLPPLSWHDRLAIPLIVFGTLIWGFADLVI